jgi:hypothetical protein
MKISRENYEPFFLDYLEGNLNESMINQFLDFLEKNPDLKAELQNFESQHLPEEEIVYTGKDRLYKSSAEAKASTEEKLIAFMEGDLEETERKSFEKRLANEADLQQEYDLFTKTRLFPDPGLIYPEKNKLYRKSGTVVLLNWLTKIAAVIILILGINALFRLENVRINTETGMNIAELAKIPESKVKNAEEENKQTEVEVSNEEVQNKPKAFKSTDSKRIKKAEKLSLEEMKSDDVLPKVERNLIEMAEISPKRATLEPERINLQLAVRHSNNIDKAIDAQRVIGFDEFIAGRVRKVGNDGLLSFHRLLHTGLGIASEISGERIGYGIREGRISSIEFDSKLVAFTIPLQKEQANQ